MKKKYKRSALGIALVAMVFVGGGLAVLFVVGGVGQSSLEAWVGTRIKAVIAESLKPTLDFESLDYQAPRTVVLRDVTLTADDPDVPTGRTEVLRARTFQLELGEIPRKGQPLKLSSASIDGGQINLIADGAGGFVGFSDLTTDTASEDPEQLLSEVLQISEIIVNDSAIVYDTRAPGTQPMRIEQIDTIVRIAPGDGGSYGLDVVLERGELFGFGLKGAFDLDGMTLAIDSVDIDLALAREQDRYLPPQIQVLVQAHELTGALAIDGSGRVDLNDLLASEARFTLGLTDGYGTAAGYRLPIKTLALAGRLSDGLLNVERIDAELLGGTLTGVASLGLREPMMTSLNLGGEGLALGQLMPPTEPGGQPQAEGLVALQVGARAPLAGLTTKLSGGGEIKLSEGRIAGLPVISKLIAFMESEGEVEQLEGGGGGTDTGHIVFELRGDHAYLSKSDIDASWYAMRGRGKVFFDQRVAMNVNAGPLEKVQNALGAVGRLVGGVTDRALVYRVRGEVGDLSVVPVPLGGIVGAPGDDESAQEFLNNEGAR